METVAEQKRINAKPSSEAGDTGIVEELVERIAAVLEKAVEALDDKLNDGFLAQIEGLSNEREQLCAEDDALSQAYEKQKDFLPAQSRELSRQADELRVSGDVEAADAKQAEAEQAAAGLEKMQQRRRAIDARVEEIDGEFRSLAFAAEENLEAEATQIRDAVKAALETFDANLEQVVSNFDAWALQ